MKRLVFSAFALLAVACSPTDDAAESQSVTVLAAASLTDALTEIAENYQAETGAEVRLSFASSSTLAQQIEAGAPADMFASADTQWMDYLAERGLIDADTRVEPIGNALVLIAPIFSARAIDAIDASLDLSAMLAPDGRLAIGDPDHVPAGIYAREALQTLGLWDDAEPRLARAEDVRGALALVARGEAPLGVVYATDAMIEPDVRVLGAFPADSHAPVVYPFALVGEEPSQGARSFIDYATGADAMAVFVRHGFAPH